MSQRCEWVQDKPAYYISYHDQVWGKPEHRDRYLFKYLLMETFHTGLSELLTGKIRPWSSSLSSIPAFVKKSIISEASN
ncbi:MAG: DNA-3-methyladenine glycosylase I [Facklamia hominis]